MWYKDAIIYQIYPLGLCGAPFENDGVTEHRFMKITEFIPHLKKLGVNCVLFNPLFESDTHGYNTRDYRRCDVRLGTNDDVRQVIDSLHSEGFRVMFDGVFNHAGRGFFAFQDVLENKWDSVYKDWFYIDFGGDSPYNDGFRYEGWEGNFDLVRLNLDNPAVADYLMESVRYWISEFGIDGLRLDVAYMVNENFLKRLRHETFAWKEDFFLFGEILGGDYNRIMNDEMCHSATNYECYKGIYSSLNSDNLFEIVHSLLRQFGNEPWCLYTGKQPVSFADNHDVSRLASIIQDKRKIPLAYALLFGMPGIPCLYYGSEWGAQGNKSEGDPALRPAFQAPEWNDLTDYITKLCGIRKSSEALKQGSFRSVVLENRHCLFERVYNDERVLVAVNEDDRPYVFHTDFPEGRAYDMISGRDVDLSNGLEVPPFCAVFLK